MRCISLKVPEARDHDQEVFIGRRRLVRQEQAAMLKLFYTIAKEYWLAHERDRRRVRRWARREAHQTLSRCI